MCRAVIFILCFACVFATKIVGQGNEDGIPEMRRTPITRMPQPDLSQNFVLSDVRGNVKLTALFLPKPTFPDDARRAGLEGTVRVQVAIDKSGVVTKATAIDGDKRLHEVAEDAAKRSRFRVSTASSDADYITGVLTYSFEIKPLGWSAVGIELRRMNVFGEDAAILSVILKSLDASWTSEIAALEKLRKNVLTSGRASTVPTFVRDVPVTTIGSSSASQRALGRLTLPSNEAKLVVPELIESIRTRLAGDETALWHFNLGIDLFSAFHLGLNIPNPRNQGLDQHDEAVKIIKSYLSNRPRDVTDGIIKALQTLEKDFAIDKPSKEIEDEIAKAIGVIQRLK